MSKIHEQVMSDLKGKKPIEVLQTDWVREKFLDTYKKFHPKTVDAEGIWESEKLHFERALFENQDLANCTGFTAYGTVIEMAVTGLSINPSWKLSYLIHRNANVGTKQNPSWEKRMYYTITPQGELALRVRLGQIKYADNPIIVYDGDLFRIGMNDRGDKYVKYEAEIPRKSKTIIGCFMRITRMDSSHDFGIMLQEDIDRLRRFSIRSNSRRDNTGQVVQGSANELYSLNDGQIDTGFLSTKCIKHSFKTYPRLQLGQFAMLETEISDDEPVIPMDSQDHSDDFEQEMSAPVQVADEEPSVVSPQDSDSY